MFNWPAEVQLDEDQPQRMLELLHILAEGCPKHPAYRARRAATGHCQGCIVVWKARLELNDNNLSPPAQTI